MSFYKVLKREAEVAFSKHSQPVWFRVLKYLVLGCLVYFLWGTNLLWIVSAVLLVLSLSLHFWYRYKTKGWTQSYGLWKYDKMNHHQNK
ncbi:MAG: hypothetical protein K0S53_3058 [Bacteroidetes bacterium]|jgi:hypothetical protein|nr:hypothetical protein [Bacteroidota bacterium]MDF2452929.1 hypothetical protein [Bacteroidota bacterium]